MLSDGETLTLTRQDTDNDVFHAACLSLGALGVIVSVKLQCEPAFRLEQITKSAKLDDVRTNLLCKGQGLSKKETTALFSK